MSRLASVLTRLADTKKQQKQTKTKPTATQTPDPLMSAAPPLHHVPIAAPLAVIPKDREASVTLTMEQVEGGQVRPRALKGLMTAKAPMLHCSVCHIGPECPEYQEGFVCAFDEGFKDVGTRDLNDVTTIMASVLEENVMRLRRARLVEDVVLGGEVDGKTTALSQVVMGQARQLGEIMATRKTVKVETRGEGVLSRIFGSVVAEKQPQITVEATTVEESVPQQPDLPIEPDAELPNEPANP